MARRHAQALSLADSVAHGALVAAENAAFFIHNIAFGVGFVFPPLQKTLVISVGNEADVLGVVFFGVDQARLFGDFTHFALF